MKKIKNLKKSHLQRMALSLNNCNYSGQKKNAGDGT